MKTAITLNIQQTVYTKIRMLINEQYDRIYTICHSIESLQNSSHFKKELYTCRYLELISRQKSETASKKAL